MTDGDLNSEGPTYDRHKAHMATVGANAVFAAQLARDGAANRTNVRVVSCNPGWIKTGIRTLETGGHVAGSLLGGVIEGLIKHV